MGLEPPNARTLWVRPAPPLTPPGPWTDQTQYLVGSQVTFPDSTSTFQAIQQHVSQPDWTPPAAPTLWKCIAGLCKLQAPSACVLAKNPDGTFRAVFAFNNTTGQNIIAPVGPTNQFSPAPADRGQPRTIAVGAHAFAVSGGPGTLTWKLGQSSTSIASTGVACVITPGAPDSGDTVTIGGKTFTFRPDPARALPNSVVAADDDGNTINPRTPGKIEANFAVNDDGGATYRIPLWVSPGRAGVQPHLALFYNSQNNSNHSPLGLGWTLTGLSEIRRCNKGLIRDGDPAP
ncbi:MAG TPA: carbohydrate-binding protein, partial [Polyangia bacterium]|nr:carbohydrate-binding protein [Polyangia bacterium]